MWFSCVLFLHRNITKKTSCQPQLTTRLNTFRSFSFMDLIPLRSFFLQHRHGWHHTHRPLFSFCASLLAAVFTVTVFAAKILISPEPLFSFCAAAMVTDILSVHYSPFEPPSLPLSLLSSFSSVLIPSVLMMNLTLPDVPEALPEKLSYLSAASKDAWNSSIMPLTSSL